MSSVTTSTASASSAATDMDASAFHAVRVPAAAPASVPAIAIDTSATKLLEAALSPCTPARPAAAAPTDININTTMTVGLNPSISTSTSARRASLEIPNAPRKRMRTTLARRPAFLRFTPDALLESEDPLTPPMSTRPVQPIPTPDAPRKIRLPESPVGLCAATFGCDIDDINEVPPVARRLLFAD